MATAIVSDLHLGSKLGVDLARYVTVRSRLCEELVKADRVIVLGDLLELRERPADEALADATATLRAIGEATSGKQLILVGGNHDHELVRPGLERSRLAGGGEMPLDATFNPVPGEISGRIAELMPRTEVVMAYPSVRVRSDIWATHGHYLDLDMTIPRPECVLGSAIGRYVGADALSGPDRYEAALSPLYTFAYAALQLNKRGNLAGAGGFSRKWWQRSRPGTGLVGAAIRHGGIPLGIAALNAAGIGPFKSDLSPEELRRAGLRAMAQVVSNLEIQAEHVIFGHTHRAGPLPGDSEGWVLRDGTRLWNTGSWIYEDSFLDRGPRGIANPYHPGRVTWIDETGPPRQVCMLEDIEPASLVSL